MALILLSKCTAQPSTTEPEATLSQRRAEALASHQFGNQGALQSMLSGLHDSSSSVADMQHPASYSSAFCQDEQVRTSQCGAAAHAGGGMCTFHSGEASASEAVGASKRQGGQTSRSECCAHAPACRGGSCKHRVERMALPLPELRRQVGIRWPQQDLHVTLITELAR